MNNKNQVDRDSSDKFRNEHQAAMARNIGRLKHDGAKRFQARLLCQSLKSMLRKGK